MKPFTKVEDYDGVEKSEDGNSFLIYAYWGKCSGCNETVHPTDKFCGNCGKKITANPPLSATLEEIKEEYVRNKNFKERHLRPAIRFIDNSIEVKLYCDTCGARPTTDNFCKECGTRVILGGDSPYMDSKLVLRRLVFDIATRKAQSKKQSPLEKKYTCLIEVYPDEMEDCNPSIPIVQFFTEKGMTPEHILNTSFDDGAWKHVVHGIYHGVYKANWENKYPSATLTPSHLSEVFELSIDGLEFEFEDEAKLIETLDRINETEDPDTSWVYHRKFNIFCEHCGVAGEFHAYLYLKPVKED